MYLEPEHINTGLKCFTIQLQSVCEIDANCLNSNTLRGSLEKSFLQLSRKMSFKNVLCPAVFINQIAKHLFTNINTEKYCCCVSSYIAIE